LGNRAASAVVWIDGVFVWEYTGGETDRGRPLPPICKMWLLWESKTHSTPSERGYV